MRNEARACPPPAALPANSGLEPVADVPLHRKVREEGDQSCRTARQCQAEGSHKAIFLCLTVYALLSHHATLLDTINKTE